MENGVTICAFHHLQLHEDGYSIKRAEYTKQQLDEQFKQQCQHDNATQFKFEQQLRGDRSLFDAITQLIPHRFQVLDEKGHKVNHYQPIRSTHVECREAVEWYKVCGIGGRMTNVLVLEADGRRVDCNVYLAGKNQPRAQVRLLC